jgi:CHASE3 domain sensor protein
MALVSVVTGVLVFLLALSLGMSYLIYVRIQDLRQEVERMRSKVEVTDEELDQIESSLDSIKV